jgi:hypothetical protein
VTEFVLPAGVPEHHGHLLEPPLDVPSGLAPTDADFHQCDERLAVEVEQDDAWWHGEWRVWVDHYAAGTHHKNYVHCSRIHRLEESARSSLPTVHRPRSAE